MPVDPTNPANLQPVVQPTAPPAPPPVQAPPVETQATKTESMVRANPILATHPDVAMALGKTQQADGNTIGHASHGLGWIGHFENALADVGNGVKGAVVGSAKGSSDPNKWGILKGAATGAENLVGSTFKFGATLSNDIVSGLSFGLLGPHGTDRAANIAEMERSMGQTLGNVENPIQGTQQVWFMMAHYGAFMKTLANRHGLAYAAGYALPSFAAAVASDGILNGTSLVGDEAAITADASTVARFEAKATNGEGLTLQEGSRLSAARARLARANDNIARSDAARLESKAAVGRARNLYKGSVAFAEKANLGTPIGGMLRGLQAVTKFAGNYRLNATMYLTELASSSNPEMKALWDQTANLQVYDQNGRPTGTLGQSLADSLGLKHDAFLRGALSGGIDAYTKYLGSDPIQVAAGFAKAARSAEGMGGMLGKWWPGIGVESGADVARNWNASAQSTRAYEFLASHSSTEIERAWPKMYPDTIRNAIGDAKTVGAVVDIHASLADAAALTRRIQPTMGAFKLARKTLINGMTVGRVLEGDVKGVEAAAAEVKRLTGYDISVTSNAEAAGSADTRMNATLARRSMRRIAYLFQQVPMHFMKEPGAPIKIESFVYRMGDHGAIPAIGDRLRSIGSLDPLQIRLQEDLMQHSTSEADMQNVVMNAHVSLISDAIASAAPSANQQMIRDSLKPVINDQMYRMMAHDGGGSPFVGVNGYGGSAADTLVDPRGSEFGMGEFGFDPTHVGKWSFIDYRAVRNMIQEARKAIIDNESLFSGHFTKLESLAQKDLWQAIEHVGSTLETVPQRVAVIAQESLARMDEFHAVAGSAYRTTHDTLAAYVKGVTADTTLSESEKFFKVTNEMVWKARNLEKSLATAVNADDIAYMSEGLDKTKILADRGALHAVRDYEGELFAKVRRQSQTLREVRKWAVEQAKTVTDVEKERRAIGKDLFVEAMSHKLYANHGFLNTGNVTVDALNRTLSKTFIPMALSTGGFIFRITTSEALLNVYRIGFHDYVGAAMGAAITRNIAHATDLAESPVIAEAQRSIAAEFARVKAQEEGGNVWEEGTAIPNVPSGEGAAPFVMSPASKEEIGTAEAKVRRDYADKQQAIIDLRKTGTATSNKSADELVKSSRTFKADVAKARAADITDTTDQMARRSHNIAEGMSEQGLIKRTVASTLNNLIQAVDGPGAEITGGMTKTALSAARRGAHDIFSGTLTGIEKGVLKGMGDEEMWRLVENTTSYIMRNGGHMPDMGHGRSTEQMDPAAGSRAVEQTMGVKRVGKEVTVVGHNTMRGEGYKTAQKEHLASAHVENLNRIFQGPFMHPSMQDLQHEIEQYGERAWPTQVEHDALVNKLMMQNYHRLVRLPASDLQGLRTSEWMIWDKSVSTGISPIMDMAKRLAMNTVGSVEGFTGKGARVLSKVLVDQAVSGKIDSEVEMAYRLASMGEAAPRHILARQFDDYGLMRGPLKELASSNFFREINRLGVDKVMGKVMSWVSRQPISAWENHLAMEALRPRILAGTLSVHEAELIADQQALRNLSQFVHNPADRFQFEANTRIYAPFWFAQNQALRRAGRVASTDFGAFDRYLRASLAITHYVTTHTIKGALATIVFPASQYLVNWGVRGAIDTMGLFTNVNPTERSILSNIGMNLNMDAGSVQTIAPTGPAEGWGMFENMFRPSSGPFVDIPLKGLHIFLHPKWYDDALLAILGPIGATSGISTDIIPSASDRAIIAIGQDVTSVMQNGWGTTSATIAGVQVKAMHSMYNNLMAKYIAEFINSKAAKTGSFLGDPSIGESAQQQFIASARIYAERKVLEYTTPGTTTAQQFVENSHLAAQAMYFVKAGAGLLGPASVSLHQFFSHSPEYQKIANTKLPDGQLPTMNEAIIEFATKDPSHYIDLVSTSQTPRGSLPEDVSFQKWYNKAPDIVLAIPAMLAYTIQRNTQYVPGMYTIMHTHGLRNQDTPQQYRTAVNVSLGYDIFYTQIEPEVYKESGSAYYGPNNPNNKLNSVGIKDMAAAAKHFGTNFNPDWLNASSYGSGSTIKKEGAVRDLMKFTSSTAMQTEVYNKGLMSGETINNLKTLATTYTSLVTDVNNAVRTGGSGAAQKAALWDAFKVFLLNPQYKNEFYLIQSVLQSAPTAK